MEYFYTHKDRLLLRTKRKVACTATSLHCFLDSKTGRPIKYLERFAELEAVLKNYMK